MNQLEQMITLAAVGAAAALGKLLVGATPLSWRGFLGTLLIGGSLGALATIPLLWVPTMPFVVQVAIASGASTLGYKVLENAVEAFVYKATGKDIDKD